MLNTIYPCIWFNGNAKEAAAFYCDVFEDSHIISENPGVVMLSMKEQKLMLLNANDAFKPNPAISFTIRCSSQSALENAWHKLSADGAVLMPLDKYDWCDHYGWVQDKYGVNWQLSFGMMADAGQFLIPSLMFTGTNAGKAAEAVSFYSSIFKNTETDHIIQYEKKDNDTEGTVKHAQFKLDGYTFTAMDSSYNHGFNFNEGVSIVVECSNQQEIDSYWDQLSAAGSEGRCGWLKDRYGVSWQVVPAILGKLMSDPARSKNVINAFMKMKKFDIETLMNA